VRIAATREEINAALRAQPTPHLVLLDIVLSDIDGFEVLAKMRQHEAVKNVPVIMATGESNAFGLRQLGEAARAAENHLISCGRSLDGARRAELDRLLDILRHEACTT
jgi:CheY-like chemotaxis protein